jgi:dTDP-glucose 4,6-dehydratase
MRILVTGGAGFIGSAFVNGVVGNRYPELAGAEVVVLDALTYAGNLENLAEVLDHPRFRFAHGDITSAGAVREAIEGADLVVHFAAESHVDRSIAGSAEFVRTNVLGTQVLLQCALDAGTRTFVHISTDEVYGSIATGSFTEDDQLSPNSPYAASKAGSDLLALSYHRTHGMDVRVTRCSNNYGPRQFPEKVIPLFVTNLADRLPVPLYGSGDNVREWLHVDDHCAAIALVAASGRPGEVYNIGGGTELRNEALTARLLEIMGLDWSMVRHVVDRKGHDLRYSVDSSKIRDELGFVPRVPFDEGLEETVSWYLDNPNWWKPLRTKGALSCAQG